jgi:hypothetical protein
MMDANPEYVGKRMNKDKMDANTDMLEKDGCRPRILLIENYEYTWNGYSNGI